MDYGYRMLRHVVAQVFGNLGQAARLTLVPTFLPLIILIVLLSYRLIAQLSSARAGQTAG